MREAQAGPILRRTPSFAGLLAAAWVGWLACPTPPREAFALDSLFGVTARYAAVLCLTTIWIGWCSAAFVPLESRRQARRLVYRMSAVSLWLAPLMVFLSQRSMWAVPVMGLFAVSVSAVLRADRAGSDDADDTVDAEEFLDKGFLSGGLPPADPKRRAAVVAVAAFGQSALVSLLVGISLAASLFLGLGVALFTWLLPASLGGERRTVKGWGRPLAQTVTGMVAAMFLVLVGLVPYVRTGDGPGEMGWIPFLRNEQGSGETESQPPKQPQAGRAAAGIPDELNASFPGVILWPELKEHVTLVAPEAMNYGVLRLDTAEPFSVPFDGVYWFLRSDGPPPENALVTRGSPVDRTFRTTSRTVPLTMVARQNFGSLIDMSCCSRIQVEIRNADLNPNTVSLQLRLVNTTLPDEPSVSLGLALVRSMPRVTRTNDAVPVRETLEFFVPDDLPIQEFDEAAISFGRDWRRRGQSVKVAVERFVLIPRGRSGMEEKELGPRVLTSAGEMPRS